MRKLSKEFTLVEVVLAMGIVIVCITTIVGLFSTGLKMSDSAIENTYKNLAIEQIAGMIETYPGMESKIPTSDPYTTSAAATTAENACTIAVDPDDPFLKNVYWNGSSAGTFKVTFQSTVNSSSVIDYTCFVKMWFSTTTTKTLNTTDGSTVNIDADTLSIQMTWPPSFNYGDRVALGNTKTITKVLKQ